jgi:addiction module HigA family antidote
VNVARLAIHPGEHIQLVLDEMSVSGAEMAARLGVSCEALVDAIEGRQSLTAELAMRLGNFFGMSPRSWLNLQMLFDLRAAEHVYGFEIDGLPTLHATSTNPAEYMRS